MKNKKYKWSYLFYLFSIIWSIDFILTILALNLRAGEVYEANLISAFFYSNGIIGYIINFIFCLSVIFLLSFFVTKLINRLKNKIHKKVMWVLIIIIFVLIEGGVIINNLMIIN